jgi:hypothetical protein
MRILLVNRVRGYLKAQSGVPVVRTYTVILRQFERDVMQTSQIHSSRTQLTDVSINPP